MQNPYWGIGRSDGELSELDPNLVPTWRTFWGTNKKGQST